MVDVLLFYYSRLYREISVPDIAGTEIIKTVPETILLEHFHEVGIRADLDANGTLLWRLKGFSGPLLIP